MSDDELESARRLLHQIEQTMMNQPDLAATSQVVIAARIRAELVGWEPGHRHDTGADVAAAAGLVRRDYPPAFAVWPLFTVAVLGAVFVVALAVWRWA